MQSSANVSEQQGSGTVTSNIAPKKLQSIVYDFYKIKKSIFAKLEAKTLKPKWQYQFML